MQITPGGGFIVGSKDASRNAQFFVIKKDRFPVPSERSPDTAQALPYVG